MIDDTYRPRVQVKKSTTGLGLFAGEVIQKDQLIIEYTGERITHTEADKRGGKYLFTVTNKVIIDGKERGNTARYINHACSPNAEAEHDESDDRIYIRARKKILPGEEITYHYGKEYFIDIIKPLGCRCQKCTTK